MDEKQRKAALRRARADLRFIMEPYAQVAWRGSRQLERVESQQNMAALEMAPDGESAVMFQKVEDTHLRRLWRLTNTLAKVREGALESKKNKSDDQSRKVYENKGDKDKMS